MAINYYTIAKLIQVQALSKGASLWNSGMSSGVGSGMGVSGSNDLFSLLLFSMLGGDNGSLEDASGENGLLSLLAGSGVLRSEPVSSTASSAASGSAALAAGSNTQYDSIILEAAATYGLDPNLIKAVIQTESGFTPNAVSSAGAQGLMQLMPGTARGLGVSNSFDPRQNIMGGSKYLSQMMENFSDDVKLALCGYNMGATRILRMGVTSSSDVLQYAKISGTARGYAEKVYSRYQAYQQSGVTVGDV